MELARRLESFCIRMSTYGSLQCMLGPKDVFEASGIALEMCLIYCVMLVQCMPFSPLGAERTGCYKFLIGSGLLGQE